jgi:hypothetical protein
MGFNILGVAIGKKSDDVLTLCKALNIGNVTEIHEEACFEDASSSYAMDDNAVYVTNLERGCLVTYGSDIDFNAINIREASLGTTAMSFVMGDTVGLYVLHYAVDGKVKRIINHSEGKVLDDRGKPLDAEANNTDVSEIIFALIGEITGTNFWQIEPDHPSMLYSVVSS